MIRKFVHLAGTPDAVTAMFHDIEAWPSWMPGMLSVKITERHDRSLRAEVEQLQMGRRLRQTMEFRCESRLLELRQIEGRFRRWSSRWRFVPASSGDGTTAAMELDFDLGPLGLMIPRRLVHDAIDDIFRRTAAAARDQLLSRTSSPAASTLSDDAARTVLEALRRGDSVVLEIAGRRYRLVQDTAT